MFKELTQSTHTKNEPKNDRKLKEVQQRQVFFLPLESKECCSFLSKSLTERERESSGNNNNNKISSFFPSGYRTHHNNGLDLLETTLARSHSAREAREPARGALGIRRRERESRERPFHIFATANSSSKGSLPAASEAVWRPAEASSFYTEVASAQ